MGLIFVALVIGVITEIFILKLYKDGEKQLSKYDKSHSAVRMSSSEELASVINRLPNSNANNIEVQGNDVKLKLKNNKYTLNVEEGIASVKYDLAGTKLKFSKFGRIAKPFIFSKSAKKAVAINSLFDKLMGKKDSNDEKEYKKVKNDSNMMWISLVVALICLFIGIANLKGDIYGEAITKVKNSEYYNGVTYGTIINGYLEAPEWKAFNSDADTAIVEVNGTSIANEKICIQFAGTAGMGFNGVSNQTFYVRYFEADGESLDRDAAMEFIYEYLGY
jgi:hypothetical protein